MLISVTSLYYPFSLNCFWCDKTACISSHTSRKYKYIEVVYHCIFPSSFKKAMKFLHLVFILCLASLVLADGNSDATKYQIQKRGIRRRPECRSFWFARGWHIYGSDYGCCGNYKRPKCCLYASRACYAHDIQCKCCTPKWYCGPSCKKAPSC